MKQLIAIAAMIMAFGVQAAEPAKAPASAAKQETNCVTKDKKGNCPPPPKSAKPTPKKKAASEAK
jgi:hypothetical protein